MLDETENDHSYCQISSAIHSADLVVLFRVVVLNTLTHLDSKEKWPIH